MHRERLWGIIQAVGGLLIAASTLFLMYRQTELMRRQADIMQIQATIMESSAPLYVTSVDQPDGFRISSSGGARIKGVSATHYVHLDQAAPGKAEASWLVPLSEGVESWSLQQDGSVFFSTKLVSEWFTQFRKNLATLSAGAKETNRARISIAWRLDYTVYEQGRSLSRVALVVYVPPSPAYIVFASENDENNNVEEFKRLSDWRRRTEKHPDCQANTRHTFSIALAVYSGKCNDYLRD